MAAFKQLLKTAPTMNARPRRRKWKKDRTETSVYPKRISVGRRKVQAWCHGSKTYSHIGAVGLDGHCFARGYGLVRREGGSKKGRRT